MDLALQENKVPFTISPIALRRKREKFSFQMLNIDQLGFNLNFCAPFPAALVDLLDRNLIDWEKEKLH